MIFGHRDFDRVLRYKFEVDNLGLMRNAMLLYRLRCSQAVALYQAGRKHAGKLYFAFGLNF